MRVSRFDEVIRLAAKTTPRLSRQTRTIPVAPFLQSPSDDAVFEHLTSYRLIEFRDILPGNCNLRYSR